MSGAEAKLKKAIDALIEAEASFLNREFERKIMRIKFDIEELIEDLPRMMDHE